MFDDETVYRHENDPASSHVQSVAPCNSIAKDKHSGMAIDGIVITDSGEEEEREPIQISKQTSPSLTVRVLPSKAYQAPASKGHPNKRKKVAEEEDVTEAEQKGMHYIKSRDAYMLVYTRRGSASEQNVTSTSSTKETPSTPNIPDLALQKLREIEARQNDILEDYRIKYVHGRIQ